MVAPLAVVEVSAVFALPRTMIGFDAALFLIVGFTIGLMLFAADFFADFGAALGADFFTDFGADFLAVGFAFLIAVFLTDFFAVFFAGTG